MRDLVDRAAFALRSRLPWGRRYRESGSNHLTFVPPPWRELPERYGLDRLAEKLQPRSLLLNLAKLDQLETLARARSIVLPARPLRVLDIGSQHFVYAPALSLFFSRWGTQRPRTVELTGIELDPYRRYWSGHTRRDLARYYASLLPWIEYRVGDFLETAFPKPFDVITWFRPHIALEPLLAAGLPRRLHRPQAQVDKALDLLGPGSPLFLSFQSEPEAQGAVPLLSREAWELFPLQRWDAPQGAVEKRSQWLQIALRR